MKRGDEPARNMTIREAFAMEMMGSIIANPEAAGEVEMFAKAAVRDADALLAELERTKDANQPS